MPYPYAATIPGLLALLRQLRSSFPSIVTAETLKKWSIASNNEGTVLAVIRFLAIIDDEGKKQIEAGRIFVEHEDAAFQQKFRELVKAAYNDLFDLFGDEAWQMDRGRLTGFFRGADQTSLRVGSEQAATFQTLASIAGHPPVASAGRTGEAAQRKRAPAVAQRASRSAAKPPAASAMNPTVQPPKGIGESGPTVTVRIELNLPVTDDQSIYDKIFQSIRANLY